MSRHRHPVWKVLLVMAADLSAIAGGLLFAYWFRFHSALVDTSKGWEMETYLRILPWACLVWLLALRFENLYRRRSRIFDFNVIRRIFTGSVLSILIFFAIAFYERPDIPYSRALVPITFGSVFIALILERLLLNAFFKYYVTHRQFGLSRTLILGGGEIAVRLFENLKAHPEHGMTPLGILTDPEHPASQGHNSIPVLGTLADLESVCESNQVDEVILAQPEIDRTRIPSILVQCERSLADFRIVPDTMELLFSGMVVETLNGIPFLGVRQTPLQGWNAALKRLIDFCAALGGLVILSPIMAIVALIVKRQDGGPVFYVQERIGLDRRRFNIYKFRTMRMDAETESGPVFADDNDPRCTRAGAILRKYRIDEIPQLINVLKGEMSLVGPRPERPFFVEQFRDDIPRYMSRHSVKSGITGWAQINGLCGKHGSINQRLRYDLYYVENWSLWLDAKILVLTLIRAVNPVNSG